MSVNSVRVMVGLASPPLEVDAWLAIGRRPLGRRLSPRAPLRVRPRRRDRAEHEACLPLRELHAQALLPMFPPHHRTPVVRIQLYEIMSSRTVVQQRAGRFTPILGDNDLAYGSR